MMKLFKKLIIAIITLIIIIALALWIASKTIKPEWIKNNINKQLSLLTGQTSEIKGAINWTIFPNPGIKVSDIQVGDPANLSQLAIKINDLLLSLEMKPLFHGKFIFKEIKVDGFNLQINPNTKPAIQAKSNQQEHQPSSSAETKQPIQFAIDEFLLSNGKVTINNYDTKLQLSNIQLRISQLALDNQFFPIQLKSRLNLKMPGHKADGHLSYKGKIKLDASKLNKNNVVEHIVTNGQFLINDFKYDKFIINNVTTSISSKNGIVYLNPLTINLYGGKSVGNATYAMNSQAFSIDQTATAIQSGNLVEDMLSKRLIEGDLDFIIKASGNLKDQNLQNTLRARGTASVKDGKLLFINVNELIDEISTRLQTVLHADELDLKSAEELANLNPEDYQKGTTVFKLLSFNFDLNQPMMVKNSLILQTNRMNLTGDGLVDLKQLTIRNELLLKVISSSAVIAKAQSIFKEGLPFKLTGPLNKPMVYPDTKQISRAMTKQVLRDTLEKPISKLKNELRNFLGR